MTSSRIRSLRLTFSASRSGFSFRLMRWMTARVLTPTFRVFAMSRVIAELRELARAHAPEAIAELARLAKDAKSETARIAAIKELLDRAYGKPTQFVAAENDEPALNDLNLEELRASMLADFERVFPEYRLVPAKQLDMIPGPEETVCDTAEACEENLG